MSKHRAWPGNELAGAHVHPAAPLSSPTRSDLIGLALHKAIAEKMLTGHHAGILAKGRSNLERNRELFGHWHPYFHKLLDLWESWFALPLEEMATAMLADGWLERDARQSSMLAGTLSNDERVAVLRRLFAGGLTRQ